MYIQVVVISLNSSVHTKMKLFATFVKIIESKYILCVEGKYVLLLFFRENIFY